MSEKIIICETGECAKIYAAYNGYLCVAENGFGHRFYRDSQEHYIPVSEYCHCHKNIVKIREKTDQERLRSLEDRVDTIERTMSRTKSSSGFARVKKNSNSYWD